MFVGVAWDHIQAGIEPTSAYLSACMCMYEKVCIGRIARLLNPPIYDLYMDVLFILAIVCIAT